MTTATKKTKKEDGDDEEKWRKDSREKDGVSEDHGKEDGPEHE